MPQVAVVIPAWNAERYLAATVASVRAQTVSDWRLTIVDDGSRDGTCALATALADTDDRIRVVSQANAGVAGARNRGLCESDPSSPFVIFLDNDDLWVPDTLEALLAALECRSECVSAHGLVRSVDPGGAPYPGDGIVERLRRRSAVVGREVSLLPACEPTRFASLVYENCIVTPGVHLMRRAALERVGGFDPDLVPCDDWDLSLRLSATGDIAYVDRVLLLWRRHDSNASEVLSKQWRRAYFDTRLRAARLGQPAHRRAALAAMRITVARLRREAIAAARTGRPGAAARAFAVLAYATGFWLRAALPQGGGHGRRL